MNKPNADILDRAQKWLDESFDLETRQHVKALIESQSNELTEAFYRDLEFGTGGLRGIMGVGTNRMNKYTVGMATQGLANYLRQSFTGKDIKVAIAHDCRHNSTFFSDVTAEVLSANGIRVYLFDAMRPVPLLSFAVRELGCQAGIVITASHNPKEYNGYKVYWEDGGQLVPPHDHRVIGEVKKIDSVSRIRFGKVDHNITILDEAFDKVYIEKIKSLALFRPTDSTGYGLKVVFTPIHGSTVKLIPMALRAFGFKNVFNVPEQDIPDGDFPTVESPNPEEPAALEMALEKAREVDADLVLATDPDGDRLGAAIRDNTGAYFLLNGNQTAALLTYYVLLRLKEMGRITGNEYIVKTIVTSDLLAEIAAAHDVECYNVLTGFKYIAEKIRLLEGKEQFICGGEESYGFLVGDLVRDKDAVISCCLLAEAASWAQSQGLSLYDLLLRIYGEHGLYVESLVSLTRKGMQGAEEIKTMMDDFRKTPPRELDGKTLARIIDYQTGIERDLYQGEQYPIDLPRSNVLQFVLENGTTITMRPSGTEPKIKFYFSCMGELKSPADYSGERARLLEHISAVRQSLPT